MQLLNWLAVDISDYFCFISLSKSFLFALYLHGNNYNNLSCFLKPYISLIERFVVVSDKIVTRFPCSIALALYFQVISSG